MSGTNGQARPAAVEGDVMEDAPRKARVPIKGGRLEPEDFDGLWRICVIYCASGIGPQVGKYPNRRKLNEPEMFAVLSFGMAAGLSIPQSLANVYLFNDKPSLHSDAIPALLLASGKCVYRDGYQNEGSENDKDLVAWAEVERRDIPGMTIRREFSMRDALKAQLLGKDGPWKQYPKRMLLMRARAHAVRDGAADILGGLSVLDEQEDIVPERRMVRSADVSAAQAAVAAVAAEAARPERQEPPALPAPSPIPPIEFEQPAPPDEIEAPPATDDFASEMAAAMDEPGQVAGAAAGKATPDGPAAVAKWREGRAKRT